MTEREDIETLENENAHLRAYIEDIEHDGARLLRAELASARAENHRLRAEVAALRDWKHDIEDDTRLVMTEVCQLDEWHCSCVPHLRREIERLRSVLEHEIANKEVCSE